MEKNIKRLIFRGIFFAPLALIFLLFFAREASGQACSPEQSQQQARYYLPIVPSGIQTQPDGTLARWKADIFISDNLAYGVGTSEYVFFSMEKEQSCPLSAETDNGVFVYKSISAGGLSPIAPNGQLYIGLSAPNDDSWDPAQAPVRWCWARIALQEVCVGGQWTQSYKPRIVYRMEDRYGMTPASAGEIASKPAREIFVPVAVDNNTDTDVGIVNTDESFSNNVGLTLYSTAGVKIAQKDFILGGAELKVFFLSELFKSEIGNMGGVIKAGILRVKGEKPIAGSGIVARRQAGAAGTFAISGNPFTAFGK